MISPETRARLLEFQHNEITEHRIYSRLATRQKLPENRAVLERIAADEKRHHDRLRAMTGMDVAPDRIRVFWFCVLARLCGFTFAVKLMENGEGNASRAYAGLPVEATQVAALSKEETEHENALLAMLDEERLRYAGSIVLGLNDALVELTGALAGFTLALQNTRLIALTGSITGVAAAMSMAASEYVSTKTEGGNQNPLKASLYTGAAYITTVALLILPYLLLSNYYVALGCTLALAVLIIAAFNYYIAVAKNQPFLMRFAEMTGLSLGVAGVSFLVGLALRKFLGVEI